MVITQTVWEKVKAGNMLAYKAMYNMVYKENRGFVVFANEFHHEVGEWEEGHGETGDAR